MKKTAFVPRFLARLLLVALCATGIRLNAQVHVAVDASQMVRVIDDRMFGVNTAIWDSQFTNAVTLSLLQAADVRTLRFPGGSNSDGYLWNLNKSFSTDSTGAPNGVNSWTWMTSFDNFAPTAVALGAQVFITVNYGSGNHDPVTGAEVPGKGAQLAADWVTYSNVTKNYGFKYWEIGNENYGTWEFDTHAVKNDPFTYANEVKNYRTAMKAVDPTIKIGVVADVGENSDANNTLHPATNPRTGLVHNGWTPVMLTTLKSLGVTPDFVIYHRYPQAPFAESDSGLLAGKSQSGTTWADDAANLRQMLTDYLGAAGASVELVVTENNSVYSNPGKQSTSLVNGLFMADSLGQLAQTEFNSLVWWALRNGSPTDSAGKQTGNFSASLYGWRTYGDYGMLSTTNSDPTPNYYVTKLLSHWARGGDQVVKVTSDSALLAAYGVRRTDGTLTILVINKADPRVSTATTPVNFAVSGFAPGATTASVFSYGIPQDDAARTGTGSPDVASTSISGVSANFQASFASYSASVVVLSPPSTSSPSQLTGSASSSTAVSLAWQPPAANGGAVTGYTLERATNSAFSQGLTTFNLGAVTSYSDTAVAPSTTYFYRVSAVNGSVVSSPSATVQVTTPAATSSGAVKLVNIATRAFCATGNNVTIGGFVISGSSPKRVLVRGVGPSLSSQGLSASEVLADPVLELHQGSAIIATNDNWSDNANASEITSVGAQIGATAFASGDAKSSALLLTLSPGVYSFIVSGKGGTSGIVLLEVYDADSAGSNSSFVNIATRAECTTGNGVTIGGFVISGSASKRVLVRAVGPTLATEGLGATEVLADPAIELHDASHGNVVIATNDNWGTNANAAEITSTSARIGATALALSDTNSAALLLSLAPGVYSFIASGKANTTGIVLVEVYDAD